MVALIFFPSGPPHLANHPPSPCPHLSNFDWPPSPLMCGHPLWMATISGKVVSLSHCTSVSNVCHKQSLKWSKVVTHIDLKEPKIKASMLEFKQYTTKTVSSYLFVLSPFDDVVSCSYYKPDLDQGTNSTFKLI